MNSDSALFGIIGIFVGYGLKILELYFNRKIAFKLSLIEKKMEVSQEAFTLSVELGRVIHAQPEGQMKVIEKSQDWFNNNCLYLNSDIRKKFLIVINRVFDYKNELDDYYQIIRNEVDDSVITSTRKELRNKFNEIMGLPKEIANSIDQQYNY